MAYDKIITVRTRLDNCINYALNEAKNDRHLSAAINCNLETAFADMSATKERWNKTGGVLGYHIVHSYSPGEVTPEQAQTLGLEFARRLLGDKYEAVVSTHIDRDHLHCHIVFNSVSFLDGSKYHNTFKDYFGDIRGISNEVSRENGLSVIEGEGGSGKHYAEWEAERTGKQTIRGLIRQDIDLALAEAFTFQSLFSILEKRGYTVKRGANIKHTAVRPPGGSRFIRLDSLGDEYTESALMRRISDGRAADRKPVMQPRLKYKVKHGTVKKRQKLHGFRALYVHYLYFLGIWKPRKKSSPIPFAVRAEVKRLNQYKRQFALLQQYRVETPAELSMLHDALQAQIDAQADIRKALYKRQRKGDDVQPDIDGINVSLRQLRQKLNTCKRIETDIPRIRREVELCREAQTEQAQEKTKTKNRRIVLWR